MQERPTSATVFGVLNIGLGLFGLLGGAVAAFFLFFGGSQEMLLGGIESPIYRIWFMVITSLGLVASLALIAAGVGLWRMEPWGRLLSVIYSWYGLVTVLIGLVMNAVFVWRPLIQQAEATQSPEQQGVLVGSLLGGLGGACFGFFYPAMLLYFMTRPRLIAAFGGEVPEAIRAASGSATAVASAPDAAPSAQGAAGWEDRDPYATPAARVGPSEPGPDRGEEILATVVPVRNKPALLAYYLGLFSLSALIPLLGVVGVGMAVVAVVQGIKGRRLVIDNPEVKGKVHAWVGILCGGLFGVLGALMQIGLVVAFLMA